MLPLVFNSRVIFAIDAHEFLIDVKCHFLRLPRELIVVRNLLRIKRGVVGLVLYTVCAIAIAQVQAEKGGLKRGNDFHLN